MSTVQFFHKTTCELNQLFRPLSSHIDNAALRCVRSGRAHQVRVGQGEAVRCSSTVSLVFGPTGHSVKLDVPSLIHTPTKERGRRSPTNCAERQSDPVTSRWTCAGRLIPVPGRNQERPAATLSRWQGWLQVVPWVRPWSMAVVARRQVPQPCCRLKSEP